jgi:hypothetical protein
MTMIYTMQFNSEKLHTKYVYLFRFSLGKNKFGQLAFVMGTQYYL